MDVVNSEVKLIKNCPRNAIIQQTSSETGKRKTKIIKDLCSGCTICMRECSFNRKEYEQIKDKYEKSKGLIKSNRKSRNASFVQ